jgi:hypothetical protein
VTRQQGQVSLVIQVSHLRLANLKTWLQSLMNCLEALMMCLSPECVKHFETTLVSWTSGHLAFLA